MPELTIEERKNLQKNIKNLRENNGLTQKELSIKLGYTDCDPVKDWERGKPIPDAKIKDIANLFQVSLNIILSEDIFESISNISMEQYEQYLKLLFPFEINEKLLKNKNFFDAFFIHNKFIKIDFDENAYAEAIECYNLYYKAYKEGIKEALINMLSISCYYKYFARYIDFDAKIEKKDIDKITFFEKIGEFNDLNRKGKRDIMKKISIIHDLQKTRNINELIETTTDEILSLLIELKKTKTYRDVAEYYISIMYMNNLINSGYQKTENALFGQMYMELIYRLGNPYALNIYTFEQNNITKCE